MNIDFKRIMEFARKNNVDIELLFVDESTTSVTIKMTRYNLEPGGLNRHVRRVIHIDDFENSYETATDLFIWYLEYILTDLEAE